MNVPSRAEYHISNKFVSLSGLERCSMFMFSSDKRYTLELIILNIQGTNIKFINFHFEDSISRSPPLLVYTLLFAEPFFQTVLVLVRDILQHEMQWQCLIIAAGLGAPGLPSKRFFFLLSVSLEWFLPNCDFPSGTVKYFELIKMLYLFSHLIQFTCLKS